MHVLLVSCRKLEWMQETKGTIPLASLYLAAMLRAGGYAPAILDLSTRPAAAEAVQEEADFRLIQQQIAAHSARLVGFNCFVSQHFPFIARAAAFLKRVDPELHITVGGAHPTLFPEEILKNCPDIDSIVLGEGEEQLLALARAVREGDLALLETTQALVYRRDGRIVNNPRREYLADLDAIPTPAWDLINLEHYYSDHTGWHNPKDMDIRLSAPIITSRSCPFTCNFCACHRTMGRTFRRRSPARVVDEIEMLNKEYGINYFGFIDDNFNLNKEHVLEICHQIVSRKLDIQFEPTCGLYLGQVDQDIARALARAGCVFARLPIEHGNDYIRNSVVGKNLPREQIFRAKNLLKENGMRVSTMSIMGFPEDTPETLQDTYDLLVELDADLNYVFNLIPFPGSRVFDQAVKDGLLLRHFDVGSLWRGEADLDPVQKEQQYYLKPKNMTLEELDVFREKFNQIRVMNPALRAA